MRLNSCLLLFVSIILTSCGDGVHGHSGQTTLESSADVTPWLMQITNDSNHQVDGASVGVFAPLFTATIPNDMPAVFTTASLSGDHKTAQIKTQAIENLDDQINSVGQADSEHDLNTSSAAVSAVSVPKSNDLWNARADELKYAGLLTQNTRSWGVVKVGEHLYYVNVGDAIGQGHWVVSDLDMHTMQLKVANRVVIYGKN